MAINCPVCRAPNSTPTSCRRCKADLSLLWKIESVRDNHIAKAMHSINEERFDEALETLETIAQLRLDDSFKKLKACLYLLAGDRDAALAEYFAIESRSLPAKNSQ